MRILLLLLLLPATVMAQRDSSFTQPTINKDLLYQSAEDERTASGYIMAGALFIGAALMVPPRTTMNEGKDNKINKGFFALGSMLVITGIVIQIKANRVVIRAKSTTSK